MKFKAKPNESCPRHERVGGWATLATRRVARVAGAAASGQVDAGVEQHGLGRVSRSAASRGGCARPHPRQRPEGVEKTAGLGALCGGLFQGLLVGCEEFGASAQRSPLPRLDLGRLALLFPAQGTARLTPHCRATSACTTPRAHMPALRAAEAQVGQPSPEAVPSAVSCSTKAEGRRVSQPVFHQARPGPLRQSLRIRDGRAGEKSGFPVH